jgi:polysaccharide biosynthesis protein PslJ
VTASVLRRGTDRPATESRFQRWTGRHPIDAVTALTVLLAIAFCIPSPLIVGPIGGSGTPANLLAVVFLLWWGLAKLGTGQDVDRGRQPVRIALLFFLLPILTSMIALYLRPYLPKEGTGALRALLTTSAWLGVALLAADGITSIERVHTLMRRVVHGAAFVASLGVLQFLTGYNAAGQLSIPGLVRNELVESQDRSVFIRIQSTTIHPIELGALMGILLPLALHYALYTTGRRQRLLAWTEVGLIAVALAMALSRTGIIAAVVGLIALAMEWTWAQRARLLAIAVVFLGAMRLAIPGLLGTLTALFTDISQDNSTQGRVQRYEIAGHYFLQNPWFGRGIGTLYPATKQVFDNAYLYQATEQGAVGLIGIALFFFILMFTARGAHLRATDPMTRGLAQVLFGTFLAMMLMFATADMGGYSMLMLVFFTMAGVAGALWRLTGGPGATDAEEQSPRPRHLAAT